MTGRRFNLLGLAGILTCGCLAFAFHRHGAHPGDEQAASPATSLASPWAAQAVASAAADAPLPSFSTGLEALPRSLEGTEVDGSLQADGRGHLVVSRESRKVFDYFLAVLGEEPLSHVRARLSAFAASRLPALAAQETRALFDRYLAFEDERGRQGAMQAGKGEGGGPDVLDAMQARFDIIAQLRQKHFSPAERVAFFGEDQALDVYTLARVRILQDASLPTTDKARRIKDLEAGLPESIRSDLNVGESYRNLVAITADWKARGGTQQELQTARAQLFGAEAAERLAALDLQRQGWTTRVQAYQQQRQAALVETGLSEVQRQDAIKLLRERLFNQQELALLDAGIL